MKRIITLCLSLTILLLTGCAPKKMATESVEREVKTFSAPEEIQDVSIFCDKVNSIGLKLYKDIKDTKKLIAPISYVNSVISLSEILRLEDNQELSIANDYINMKNFINSYLQEIVTDNSIWIKSDLAKELGTYRIEDNSNEFNFYLVNSQTSNKKAMIEAYLANQLGIKYNIQIGDSKAACELLNCNFLKSKIIINGSLLGITENDNSKVFNIQNLTCKSLDSNGFNIIELPIKSNNSNLIIDIFIPEDGKKTLSVLEDAEILQILKKMNTAKMITFNEAQLPGMGYAYNLSDKDILSNNGLKSLYEDVMVMLDTGEEKEIKFNKLNQLSSINLDYVFEEAGRSDHVNEVLEIPLNFNFIIRDPANNLILYIR